MKDIPKLFEAINKSKITQRDKFILYFMLCLSVLIESIGLLVLAILAKQLPDIVELLLKALHII